MWTALLFAGDDTAMPSLAASHGVAMQALVPVAGETMVTRAARTLLACPRIDRLIVVSVSPEILAAHPSTAWLAYHPRVQLAVGDTLGGSVAAIAGTPDAQFPLLVASTEHPLLTAEMVGAFLSELGDADVAMALVSRDAMLRQFPDAQRPWSRFRDGGFCSVNLFALTGPAALGVARRWGGWDRRRGGLMAMVGASGLLSLWAAMAWAGRRNRVRLRAIVLDDAAAAVAMDHPADHALAEMVLAKRASAR